MRRHQDMVLWGSVSHSEWLGEVLEFKGTVQKCNPREVSRIKVMAVLCGELRSLVFILLVLSSH